MNDHHDQSPPKVESGCGDSTDYSRRGLFQDAANAAAGRAERGPQAYLRDKNAQHRWEIVQRYLPAYVREVGWKKDDFNNRDGQLSEMGFKRLSDFSLTRYEEDHRDIDWTTMPDGPASPLSDDRGYKNGEYNASAVEVRLSPADISFIKERNKRIMAAVAVGLIGAICCVSGAIMYG